MVAYSKMAIKLLQLQNSKTQATETISEKVFMVNGPKSSVAGHRSVCIYVSLSSQGSVEESLVC